MAADTEQDRPERTSRGFAVGVLCLVLGVACFRISDTIVDPDLWGHLLFGRDILKDRGVAPRDEYSYLSAGQPYIEWEWLSKAALALVFNVGGPPGLIVFKVVLSLVMVSLLYRHLLRSGLEPLRAGMLLLVVVFLWLPGMTTVRVHLFTYFLFLIVLFVLWEAEGGRLVLLGLLPPLFVLWANLHPGFVAGMAVAGVWTMVHVAVELLRQRGQPWKLAAGVAMPLLALALSLAGTLCNPYGLELWRLLVEKVPGRRLDITEFHPIDIVSLQGAAYLLLLAASIAGLLYSERPRRLPLVAVFICTAALPLVAVRHAPLFTMAAVVMAGEHVADLWQRRWPGVRAASGDRQRSQAWLNAACFLGAGLLVALSWPHFRAIRFDAQQPFPAQAVTLLKESHVRGRLVVFFDWGDYALWYLTPEIQVSLDGRRETVYSDAVYLENMLFMNGTGDWDALLEDGAPELVLVPRAFPAFNLMKLKPGWVSVHEDSVCGLFVRAGSPQLEALKRTPVRSELPADGAGMQFPSE